MTLARDRSAEPYVINGDHLRSKVKRKQDFHRRLRMDMKPGRKQKLRRKLAKSSVHFNDFVNTFVHQVSAQIVSFAVRGKYESVVLDDAITSFVPHFPWYDLRQKIAYKCEDKGILFSHEPSIAFEPCQCFDRPTPHIYFAIEVDRSTNEPTGNLKIGKTTKPTYERMVGIGDQTNMTYEPIAVFESKKSNLSKDEKMFHALFAEHRIAKDRELFTRGPIETWLRERGAIASGNTETAISEPKGNSNPERLCLSNA